MKFAIAMDLTLREIVANIPHDGRSVLVYGVLVLFGLAIWWGSRQKAPAGPAKGE